MFQINYNYAYRGNGVSLLSTYCREATVTDNLISDNCRELLVC